MSDNYNVDLYRVPNAIGTRVVMVDTGIQIEEKNVHIWWPYSNLDNKRDKIIAAMKYLGDAAIQKQIKIGAASVYPIQINGTSFKVTTNDAGNFILDIE